MTGDFDPTLAGANYLFTHDIVQCGRIPSLSRLTPSNKLCVVEIQAICQKSRLSGLAVKVDMVEVIIIVELGPNQ